MFSTHEVGHYPYIRCAMFLQIATVVFVFQSPKVFHRNINRHRKTEMPHH